MLLAFTRILFSSLVVVLGLTGKAVACDKIGHDCVTALGTANIRDLPFRIARSAELFLKRSVYPDVRSTVDDGQRLASLRSGEALVGIASPQEAVSLITADNRFKIIAVLQSRPASQFAVKNQPSASFLKTAGTRVSMGQDQTDRIYVTDAFSKQGLQPKDYALISTTTQIGLADVSAGKTTAAVLDPLSVPEALRLKLVLIPLSSYVDDGLVAVLIGRIDQLKPETEGIIRLLRGLSDAVKMMRDTARRATVIEVVSKEYRLPADAAARVYDLVIVQTGVYSADLAPTPASIAVTNRWLIQSDQQRRLQESSFDLSYVKAASVSR